MPDIPDPSDIKPYRQDDAYEGRLRDSDDDLLSENTISSPPHPRHPVAARIRNRTSRGEGPPVTLFSIFTGSTASLQNKSHQINNHSTEAMLEIDSHFPNDNKSPREHREHIGHECKPSVQPIDQGFVHAQSSTMKAKIKAFLSLRKRKNNAPSVGPRQRVVANVAFAEALHEENPSPWSKHMLKLYFFIGIAFLNSLANGYDASLMGGINNMAYYRSYGASYQGCPK